MKMRTGAALALLALLAACERPLTVEQQIIATIRNMEAEIESDERREFMAHVSEDFSGQRGSYNRDQVRALLIMQLNRHQRLQGQLFPVQVTDSGDGTAQARFRALVTGGPRWIPDSGQLYDFETYWRQDDGDWVVYAANWTPVALDQAL